MLVLSGRSPMSQKKTKILIVSESPIAPTGMGEVVRLIFGTLLDRYPGHYDLHQVGLFHGCSVATPSWPVYPTRGATDKAGTPLFLVADVNGEITFRELLPRIRPDIVFAFNDTQRVLHLCWPAVDRKHKLILYVNLDGFPFPPNQGPLLDRADLLFTMSEFSSRVAASIPALRHRKIPYMYSPADITRFRPVAEAEKRHLRAQLFPDWMPKDGFVLGWIGRNQWRKQVWILYEVIHHLRRGGYRVCEACGRVTLAAAARHAAAHSAQPLTENPNNRLCRHCRSGSVHVAQPLLDVFLWLHMPEEPHKQDWRRSLIEHHFDLRAGRDIHYTEGHRAGNFRQPEQMPMLYQCWDCFLYLSGGEGFGLPPWEAMCAGIPVVYTNYSSHAEFLSKAGAGLAVGGTLQPEQDTAIWRMIADVPQAIEATRRLYFQRELGRTLGANGTKFVAQHAAAVQAARWHGIFQQSRGHLVGPTARDAPPEN